ncbi:MAG TPA: fused MFS/spermidine synthase [Pirellulaceae bacterium]|nr:fused MFS/spermidine synthase [Pirellulaceae bacterium]
MPDRSTDRTLPLLLLLFVGSGCAALIYEIVWFQLLQLVIGSSAVSLGVLLGTFMGGMCLGSLLLPRVIGRDRHPLAAYAYLELGIGAIGIAALFVVPLIGRLYTAWAGYGIAGYFLRGAVAALCLLPPTVLMGATLPAIARWVEATPRGVSWLGFFYGGNIAGAVLGCLLAGFYLLRIYDMATATYVAAAINLAVALVGLALAARTPYAAPARHREAATSAPVASANWTVLISIGLSGLAALAAEVVWTRLLSLMLGGSVYTFSIILSVFLIGLGIGSSIASWLARGSVSPRVLLGGCQLLLAATIAWAAFQLARSLPYWPIDPSQASSPWHTFQLDVLRCAWAILPSAVLWGASFPLALAAASGMRQLPDNHREANTSRSPDPGRLVGAVYAANTIGAILGAVGTSVWLIPAAGTQYTQQLLILISAGSAVVALAPLLIGGETSSEASVSRRPGLAGALALLAGLFAAWWLSRHVPPTPGELIAEGRYLATRHWEYPPLGSTQVQYQGEGMNSSVAVTLKGESTLSFHVSGKVEASTQPQDMRLQRMLGHIPALVHPNPRTVLVVGCGAGVTAGSFLAHPEVERIVICELEPPIPKEIAPRFGRQNYDVVKDPKVQIVYDDARHYILTTRETFDIITSDPIHPWVKGAATLYTQEYFELCKARLNPGGVITQWVPLYESSMDVVKSEVATFFAVFPEGTVWSNDSGGAGYDTVLLGHVGPLTIDVDRLEARVLSDDLLAWSLEEVGFLSGLDLLATYAGTAQDLAPWTKDAQLNRDRNLRLQYLAGLSSHNYREAAIYNAMVKHRTYPDKLFKASETNRVALMIKLGMQP